MLHTILRLADSLHHASRPRVPKEGLLFRDNQMLQSESFLRRAHSLQPASHLRAQTIEVVGSVPVRSSLRDSNHQLTAKSKKNWGSLSLPSRFKPDLGLLRTFGVDLSTSPGSDCSHASPCVGPVGIEPTFTTCKSSCLTTIQFEFL